MNNMDVFSRVSGLVYALDPIGSHLNTNAFIHEQTTTSIHEEELNWCTPFSDVS